MRLLIWRSGSRWVGVVRRARWGWTTVIAIIAIIAAVVTTVVASIISTVIAAVTVVAVVPYRIVAIHVRSVVVTVVSWFTTMRSSFITGIIIAVVRTGIKTIDIPR